MADAPPKSYVPPPSIGHELGIMFGFIGTVLSALLSSPLRLHPIPNPFVPTRTPTLTKDKAQLTCIYDTSAHVPNDVRLRNRLANGVNNKKSAQKEIERRQALTDRGFGGEKMPARESSGEHGY
ncbi:MAG: hypothetical protein M1836_003773 [Candelina mexicana]|nr:MAG: hypothetical protein M1836_003773 [Candelina mexicana]